MMRTRWPSGAPPLVAILRGLRAERAQAVGACLFDAGLRCLEVPLNRPQALACIELLRRGAPDDALVGGGTVLEVPEVDAVRDCGGQLIVAPNCDLAVIGRAVDVGLFCAPGVATPSEAFQALRAGADALKLFPAEQVGPAGLRAWRSVLPSTTRVWPVGGIDAAALRRWHDAGANGYGIGSALFTPDVDLAELARRARALLIAWRALNCN